LGRFDGSKFAENKRRREFLLIGLAGGAGLIALAALGTTKKEIGNGTLNKIPKWTPNAQTLGNSAFSDDGVSIISSESIVPSVNGGLAIGNQTMKWGTIWLNGVLNIGGDISPATNTSQNCGTATNNWATVFTQNLRASAGTFNFNIGGTNYLQLDSSQLYSTTDLQLSIGTATHRFANVFTPRIQVGASKDLELTVPSGNIVFPTNDTVNDFGNSTHRFRDLYLNRNLIMDNIISKYNGITTAGFGVPIIVAEGDSIGNTGTITSVCAYTVGASNGVFKVGGDIDVTAFTSGAINLQVTYTDWNSGAQTITIDISALAVADTPGNEVTIMAKASTSITIKTTGTFTATYNVAATIVQYK